ncbi:MAG TPA: YidC/Oxa1 family membrane protein insertase [Erysipelothrix sp.]|nr:YidC/Oxa1 family membrane protein insertase [Erysipelothrix sp.]
MKNFIKKHKKLIGLAFLLVLLVGCKSVIDPETREVMEQYVIRLGDKFPWGQEGYGWFAIFVIWPIAQLFNLVASKTGAFWSLIIVTILIDVVKLPSTINQTVQQQKMTELQPQMARIEEKYRGRDDQQSKMMKAQEMQRLYEKNDINMFGSIIPLFLQFPIILAVFQAVQRADLIINGSFMGHSFKGSPKDGFMSSPLNKVYIGIYLGMVLFQALSMFLPQYLQKKNQPKRPQAQTDAPNPQGMMVFSLGMITLLAFTWNVGMSVYWGISALTRLLSMLYVQYFHTDK